MHDSLNFKMIGRVQIQDLETGILVREEFNEIHPQNMALIIARALARDDNGAIYSMSFGNGGTFTNSSGTIVYRPPNTIGASELYNPTYSVLVDEQAVGTPVTNSVTSAASPSPAITSVVTVIAQLNANEPAGQAIDDASTVDSEAPYIFDEIGLKSQDGLLLTHMVFSPFEKAGNRAFLFTYTLTISVS